MDYRVFNRSSGENEDSIEAHVLARAYRAVWRSTHGSEPVGQHPIAGLELVIDFGGQLEMSVGNAYPQFASSAQPDTNSSARPGANSIAHRGSTSSARPGAESPACSGAHSPARPGANSSARPGTNSSARPGTNSSARPGATSTARSDESATAGAYARREGDIASELWMRVRQFGKRMPSEELDQLISELRALEQPGNSGSRQSAQCRKRRRDD